MKIEAPKTVAAGIPAIEKSLEFAWTEAGPIRGTVALLKVNQKTGFDCPGCAWPDPDHRSITEFCENGAKAVAEETTTERATPDLFRQFSVAEMLTRSDYWIGKRGRLTHPMVLREGATHYAPIEWDEAFALIAAELRALSSPHEALFYTSGRTSNEAAFLYQLFARKFGTNNLPDCSNMCHESSGTGLTESIGVGKGTVTLEDFDHADAIFVIGQNPGTNHPRMLTTLGAASQRGCKIVSVNPLFETGLNHFKHPQHVFHLFGAGMPIACLHLPVRINGDVAFLKGMMKIILEKNAEDRDFIATHTAGFETFREALDAVTWPEIETASGLSRQQIEAATQIAIEAKNTIVCWAMGITQHKNGVANVQEIANFLLLRGNMGRPGAGACPVRGHSNVQGDRTMGIWEKMPESFLQKLDSEFHFTAPRDHGYDAVAATRAMHEGKARVFFGMGGNFLSAMADTDFVAEAMRQCNLTVHVSTKPNRAHLVTGKQALILPCLGRTEKDRGQFVTVEDSMSMVHASHGHLEPASEHLLSECQIVAGLAKAVLGEDWSALIENYDLIRDHISRVIPGFENFNEHVRKPGGFWLGNAAARLEFHTATDKANFTIHPIPSHPLEPGRFLLMTIRSHDQYNTTIYGLDDRYRGIYNGRHVVFLNPEDMAEQGIAERQQLDITSYFEGEQRIARGFAAVPYQIPRGCAAAYYPETNVLVPIRSFADRSLQPASKSIVVSFKASSQTN
jgi:molybdopterin-dependent oxidoreductase alpha subunit